MKIFGYFSLAMILSELIFGSVGQTRGDEIATVTIKPSEADFLFGPEVTAREYSTREAVKWGTDFFVSWSRATDRKIMYGYKLENIDRQRFQALIEDEAKQPNDLLIAIINLTLYGPSPILGMDKGYPAAPILLISPAVSKVANLSAAEYEYQFKQIIIPSIVAISSLKKAGKDVSKFEDVLKDKTEGTTYIATSKELSSLKVDKYFLVANSAWTFPLKTPMSTWGIRIKPK